ncbi:hypothetical protein GCM10027418_06300 [Mariniluteicoccus endophyticus]
MYHPWAEFARHTAWELRFAVLPSGVWGLTCWKTRTVTLHSWLLQAERRCTIAHELLHIERGPLPRDPFLAEREEAIVRREAARRLIGIVELGDALVWAYAAGSEDVAGVADELWCDEDTVRARLEHLHPAERAYLVRRMEAVFDAVGA